MESGVVEGIFIVAEPGGRPQPVERANAIVGEGLEGDRYQRGKKPLPHRRGSGRDLTLIEAEAIEGLERDTGIRLGPGESRRNVVTRGVDLNALVGRRFAVGRVEAIGRLRNDPCNHLEQLTQPGVRSGLEDRGGLRADLVSGGEIAVGDPVVDRGPAE